ncbi:MULTISPECIES: BlaI/MecI/CopY family transcriptional regulator [Kordiimonas]|uniref:BlaI/MecI/CopY family transcriptional regulator n=1 Tax=Kordiimonas TaxID=288021 RepID=UPI001FF439C2|nr:BlaI/MecI/CopY family transcriptional regulator [Kordiimonas sp. SCSIO 12603]MCK0068683.1 BlaI/MecI/CopY family transcriptional regulator [Kordiimonas laminariae]UTW58038.1 BlaI/MecI/CopY family transcriptional regulator [Kordiimonas sp. SCSIO 12603]
MAGNIKLSEQQYQVVQALWSMGEGSARDVQAKLSNLGLAHTTIGTILSRLEKREVLSSRTEGRQRVYKALITDGDVKRSMVSNLISTLFKGDSKALLAHLVSEGDIHKSELDDIKSLLDGGKKDA